MRFDCTSAREAAYCFVQQALFPIPVPFREKRPLLSDWPQLRITAEEIPKYFDTGPSNIGLILGERGVADVDLDCREALLIWPEFAPCPTWTFGRRSAPDSHSIYRTSPALRSAKYLDEKDVLIELRGLKTNGTVGMQTIVPPSTHKETGEPIAFASECPDTPAIVDGGALSQAVTLTAAAALLARYFPQAGRNEAFLALAGVFAGERWPQADALKFARGIYRVLWPGNPDFAAAAREVQSTYSRFDASLAVIGMARLRMLVDEKILRKFSTWLKLYRPPDPIAAVDISGMEPTIELLNSLALWGKQIHFRSVSRRGPLLIAETEEAIEIVFPTVPDLVSFSKAQSILAEATGVLLATPAKHRVHEVWEPAARLFLKISGWGKEQAESDLVEEVRELVCAVFERAGSPTVTDDKPMGFVELLRMCAMRARNPKEAEPPVCCCWLAEGFLWIHLPSLQGWLSTPAGMNRHYEWAQLKRALLLLKFRYRKDLTRSAQTEAGETVVAKASVWQGSTDILG